MTTISILTIIILSTEGRTRFYDPPFPSLLMGSHAVSDKLKATQRSVDIQDLNTFYVSPMEEEVGEVVDITFISI